MKKKMEKGEGKRGEVGNKDDESFSPQLTFLMATEADPS
jgi:hypothetical protein